MDSAVVVVWPSIVSPDSRSACLSIDTARPFRQQPQILCRGKCCRSTNNVRSPARLLRSPVMAPATPAPMITTSKCCPFKVSESFKCVSLTGTPSQQEPLWPVHPDRSTMETCLFREDMGFVCRERTLDRHGAVDMNDMARRQDSASQPGQPVSESRSPQIVNQDQLHGGLSHALQKSDCIALSQMMQKQAAHHDIVCRLRKRLLQCVAQMKADIIQPCCHGLFSCKCDRRRANVAPVNAYGALLTFRDSCKTDCQISATGSNVQNGERSGSGRRRSECFDGVPHG